MNRNLITPRVNEFIIKNSPVWAELTKKASTIAKLLRDDAIAADGNGVKLLGFVYSNSLYEDGTDNIFYQVYGGRTENQKEGFIEIKFVHNATQLFTGLIVSRMMFRYMVSLQRTQRRRLLTLYSHVSLLIYSILQWRSSQVNWRVVLTLT